MRTFKKPLILTVFSVFATLSYFMAIQPAQSQALSGTSFNAGRIIDDSLFFKNDSMTLTQIQNFLNAKVPSCDTNGTLPYAGTTRKLYAASKGISTPFICLKSYKQDTQEKAGESGLCSVIPAKTNRSAAQIIDDVASACGVSEKVLLTLLQKEQSLVTDDWPWPIQYRSATGYGCPDTASCDSQYYGFFNQVYSAARQFKRYAADGGPNYWENQYNIIKWNPSASCGTSKVYIQNQATAGLYNYTPYRPNPAALSNLYGEGDSCSSYGNRNFWRMYNDWFGSPTVSKCTASDKPEQYVIRLFNKKTGSHFYTALKCEAAIVESENYWVFEGIDFYQPTTTETARTGIYRLVKRSSGERFWTESIKERDNLARHNGYIAEGTAFIGYGSTSTATTKIPVYRLYNSKTGSHLWTASVNERNSVDASPYWRYEGIAYYVSSPPI